jgi:hypothetical protein
MKISLADNIIVFDEAHNIEDSLRETTSFEINYNDIMYIISTCKVATINHAHKKAYNIIVSYILFFMCWCDDSNLNVKSYSYLKYNVNIIINQFAYSIDTNLV